MYLAKPDILVCSRAVGTLVPGSFYHFLKSPSWSNCSYLVQYALDSRQSRSSKKNSAKKSRKPEPIAILHVVNKEDFEAALAHGVIVIHEKSPSLPPWMFSQTEGDLISLSERRRSTVESHQDRIDKRVAVVYETAIRIDEILNLDDPISDINSRAKQNKPVQHVTRFRCWLFTYLLFGSVGLHFATANIGRWSRKLAAENRNALTQSTVTEERAQKIVFAYHKHKSEKLEGAIYATAMRVTYGCLVKTNELGRRALYHPKGDWFPSERIFFYHVDQSLNLDDRRKNRLGAKRYHNDIAPSMGSFTEFVGNAYERVEYDPFHNSALPKGVLGATMPKLITGRLRDAASGMITGISFDMGGETLTAYYAAQFCAAVDKQRYCRLFGIDIQPWEWPCVGISLKVHMDRGPASSAIAEDTIIFNENIELAPSGKGQAKAIVESSHPRSLKQNEGPSYLQSDLSIFQMCKQEILRVLKDNESFDVSERIPAEWMDSVDRATPLCLFNEFVKRGRCDAEVMSFDSAVRKYLPLAKIDVTRDGITFVGEPFVSPLLQETDFFHRIPKGRTFHFDVYFLRACVHHVWLDYKGQIFELVATSKINNGVNSTYWSYDELCVIADKRRVLAREVKEHAKAVRVEIDGLAEEITGRPLGASVRRSGRVRRSRQSVEEGRMNIDAVRGKL